MIGLTSKRRALVVTSALVVGVLLWRIALYSVFNVTGPPLRYGYSPDTRLDAILVGCVLGIIFSFDGAKEKIEEILPKYAIWIGVSIVLGSIYLSERSNLFMYTVGYTLVACGCAFIVASTIL
jgi:peptidoglycan/LPS O-acetylase OafA/YrhL